MWLTLAAFIVCASASAQPPKPIVIDATAPVPAPGPANYSYVAAEATSPSGHTLGLNARYLTLDGKPWLPVMGEMHYSRVPESEWEDEILKMKSAGVQVIATYLIWIHHEEVEGQWDWSGNKDLRRFVQLCAKHGMYVVPRIGPWSHAEVRNGGFPDWLLEKTKQQRSNDPGYLSYVDLYDRQIASQLKGLMWSEGGPVIAIQLENEYRGRGAGRGNDHILKLKQMAREDGLKVPFYTVTGWDGASIPSGAVLPVYGGYPDAPWDASIEKLKPSEVYAFRFGSRVTGDMGAIGGGQAPTGNAANFTTDTPFMTAEMGGGMQVTYHRRPVVSADDIAAMVPTMLGSGVNLYGSYMFQGGENPDGKTTTLQESLATHYANDLPQKTYDFEAPLGEFGDERESLLKLKSWNYFMNDFGPQLAPMQARRPDVLPANPADRTVPRVSARTLADSGFLFVNNHVRGYDMPLRPGFQVELQLPGGKALRIPEKPIDIPSDAYFVWPFGMQMDGITLRYATAQPLAKIGTAQEPVYVFFAQTGIQPEFVFENTAGLHFEVSPESTGGVQTHDGALWFPHLQTSEGGDSIRFLLPNGRRVTVLLLDQQQAEHAWLVRTRTRDALVQTEQQAFVDDSVITLQNLGGTNFKARVLPETSGRLVAADAHTRLTSSGAIATFNSTSAAPGETALTATPLRPAADPAPLPEGFKPSSKPRVVAAAPAGDDWKRAAEWQFALPKAPSASTGMRQFLKIRYAGDVARLSVNGRLLDDNFSDGRPWLVGLERFRAATAGKPLQLAIYPLRPHAPIFFEPGLEPKPQEKPLDTLESIDLVTESALRLRFVPAP
jgi:hypothetical protein